MQSLVEQQEAANEEMQSANEEIQSANEELQSVNEELQTSKEEIQSSNEELSTVNDELRHRNDLLDRAHNDLNNFVGSSNLAMVVVGVDLRIRRFSPAAEKLLNLIAADVGRPIGDLKLPLETRDLEQRLIEVVETVRSTEHEVQDRNGRWYSLRLRPYRTMENKIEGAVLLLVDIEEQKRAQADILASEEKYRLLVEGARGVAIMLLDRDGRVAGWNVGAERILGYSESEIVGEHFSRFFVPDDRAAGLPQRELLQAQNNEDAPDDNWLIRNDGSRFWASGVTTALTDSSGQLTGFSKVVRDITDRKRGEEDLRNSQAQLAAELSAMSRLHELSTSLLECTDFGTALEQILDSAIAICAADMGSVQLFDPQRNSLGIVVHRGFKQDVLDFFSVVDAQSQAACGRAVRSGAPVVIEDVEIDPEYALPPLIS